MADKQAALTTNKTFPQIDSLTLYCRVCFAYDDFYSFPHISRNIHSIRHPINHMSQTFLSGFRATPQGLIALCITAIALTLILNLSGCSSTSQRKVGAGDTAWRTRNAPRSAAAQEKGNEVALFSLGLMNIGYRFGGKNPEAGLDCSGMVSYVFSQSANLKLQGSAAEIAQRGRPIGTEQIYPGDLVFFNTLNRPKSHVGIYLGEGRFIHAPSSQGKVKIDSLTSGWFATRFEEARSYFE